MGPREELKLKRKKTENRSRRWVTPFGAQTKPQVGYCRNCKRTVLTARYDAQPRHWDPQPLSSEGELIALLLGLKTWWIFDSYIYKRNAEAIKSSPTGRGGIILRDHNCSLPQPQGSATNFRMKNYDSEDPGF